MMKLYDSAFSPFARKVRMTLEYKELSYEAVDGLLRSNHEALKAVNGRVEVPALVDDDIVVANSADIVAYLDYRYPAKCVYPNDSAARVHARAWERVADTFVDPSSSTSRIGNGLNGRTRCLMVCLKQRAPTFASSMTPSTRNSPSISS